MYLRQTHNVSNHKRESIPTSKGMITIITSERLGSFFGYVEKHPHIYAHGLTKELVIQNIQNTIAKFKGKI